MYSMTVTGAAYTAGAEDDFSLIQEVNSFCTRLYSTWHLRSYPRGQQFLSSFLSSLHYRSSSTCWSSRVELGRTSLWRPSIHGFDDEAQDGLSLGVHGTLPLDTVLLKCFFELAPVDALQEGLREFALDVLGPWSKPSLARWPLSLLRFGHKKSRGPFARLHQRFVVLLEQRAEGGRLQLADLQIVFQGQTGQNEQHLLLCVWVRLPLCTSRRFVLCDLRLRRS